MACPHVDRRHFIRSMTAGAAGIIASDGMAGRLYAAPQSRSGRAQINPDIPDTRVVCCHDPSMVTDIGADGFTQQNNAVDTARVVADMDAMACALAGRSGAPEAWDVILRKPDKPAVRAAIKVNSLDTNTTAHVAVVGKVVSELVRTGVQPSSISIYDLNYGTGTDVRSLYNPYVGNGIAAGVMIRGKESATGSVPVPGGSANCATFIGETDILVNIASNKGHYESFSGGFTLTMKNHYGTFGPSHDTNYLFNINRSDMILGGTPPRQRLCIVDSLLALGGGPFGSPDKAPLRLVMGTMGPVVDYLTVKKIREEVMGAGHNQTIVGRLLSDFGFSAGALEWIEVPPAGSVDAGRPAAVPAARELTVRCPRGRPQEVRIATTPGRAPDCLDIYDEGGALVRSLSVRPGQAPPAWDGRDRSGRRLPAGAYLVHVPGGARGGALIRIVE